MKVLLVHDVEELYEKAMNQTLETHRHYDTIYRKLFISYIYQGNFQKQQQLAMRRYQKQRETVFLYWNVICLFLQGIYAHDLSEKRLSFQLAKKIMEKLNHESKITQSEQLLLYMTILEEDRDYEMILKIIQSPLSRLLKMENDRRMLELLARKNLEHWKEVYYLCYNVLVRREEFTDWKYYDHYITAAIELAKMEDDTKR
jgi:hypothetical protein